MFDLRYHVASLAAVFVALLIGILVGVAMSGKVDDAEKQALKSDVSSLNAELEAAGEGRANFTREQASIRAFVKNAYPSLIAERLAEKRIASPLRGHGRTRAFAQDIERTIADAGAGTPTRMRALNVPIDVDAVERQAQRRPQAVPRRRARRARASARRRARRRRRHAWPGAL